MKDKTIEAEARRMIADKLRRMPWWPNMSEKARQAALQADVDRYWPVMAPEATEAVAARLNRATVVRASVQRSAA